MLNIFYSNKLEALATQLNALIHQQPLPPLVPETIMVESSAMAQWLTEQMACQLGIAAHLKFPFPAATVWQIFRQQMPELPKSSGFDRGVLIWRLYVLFTSEQVSGFGELQHYLAGLANHQQILAFAEHVADLYDQYQIYRPDWLSDWKVGRDDHWQARVWRYLCQEASDNDPDRATVYQKSLTQMPMSAELVHPISRRLHIFAVATLPQSYLQLFSALADTIDVNIFVLNPCAMFWGNLQSEKQRIRQVDMFAEEPEEAATVQNELLALMAKQGRDYINLLQQQSAYEEHDCYVKVAGDSLLTYLQNDMLTLRQPAADEPELPVTGCDRSLQFHSCHSPLREVQVLHDRLLAMLDNDPALALEEIAIMVPDLETYAPYFHAVFATAEPALKLDYHLAERRSFDDQPVKRTLLQLMNLPQGQFRRSEVVSLLQEQVIAERFGLEDLTLINQLLEDLQVRFGLTDDIWQSMGQDVSSFSWQQARSRLLASFAQAEIEPAIEQPTVAGIYNEFSDQAGRLLAFIDQLTLLERQQPRSLIRWCDYVAVVLESFYQLNSDTELQQAREVRNALDKIRDEALLASFEKRIELELFMQRFEQALQQGAQSHYFRKGAINIATLLPMRSLPFKVVCLLGMNDGEFPRPGNTDAIDLMVQHPRQGDRNRREEDRYLFLEALLAARQCCYISYIGRSQIDNTERYPSLLVTELLEHLDNGYCIEGVNDMRQHLVVEHHLQPFDARYFENNIHKQSFNAHLYQQAQQLQQPHYALPAFSASLTVASRGQLLLAELVDGLANPAKAYLSQLNMRAELEALEDENLETFSSDGLQRYQLLDLLFERLITEQPLPSVADCCRAGLLPQSELGKLAYQQQLETAESLLGQVNRLHLQLGNNRKHLALSLDGVVISGEINACNSGFTQRLAVLANKLHGKHLLKAWVTHLFACASLELPIKSYLLSADACYRLRGLDKTEARQLLQQLLNHYQRNLLQLSWLLPRSGWAYIEILQEKGDQTRADNKLASTLLGSGFSAGEWFDAVNQFAYRGMEPDLEQVRSVAETVFNPMLDVLEKLEVDA